MYYEGEEGGKGGFVKWILIGAAVLVAIIVIVLINGTGENDRLCKLRYAPVLQVIRVKTHLYAVKHLFYHLRVAADGDALIQRVKVIVIVSKTNRKTLYDERGELSACPSPLLLRVFLDEFLINVTSHE